MENGVNGSAYFVVSVVYPVISVSPVPHFTFIYVLKVNVCREKKIYFDGVSHTIFFGFVARTRTWRNVPCLPF